MPGPPGWLSFSATQFSDPGQLDTVGLWSLKRAVQGGASRWHWPSRSFHQLCPQPSVYLGADSPTADAPASISLLLWRRLDATPAITLTVLGKHWFLLSCFKESGSSFCGRAAAPVGRKRTQGPGGHHCPGALSAHVLYIKAISGGQLFPLGPP